MNTTFLCPYCGSELTGEPKSKKKCQNCKSVLIVRTDLTTREKIVLTEEGARIYDERLNAERERKFWIKTVSSYGLTEADFYSRKDQLADSGKASDDMAAGWSLLLECLEKLTDHRELKGLLFQMAFILYERGGDFLPYLKDMHRQALLGYKKSGFVKKVSISSTHDSCPACKRLANKTYTIEEALEKMPLPCSECSTITVGDTPGWCRCSYLPELPNYPR